jgi:hypothetical protein
MKPSLFVLENQTGIEEVATKIPEIFIHRQLVFAPSIIW